MIDWNAIFTKIAIDTRESLRNLNDPTAVAIKGTSGALVGDEILKADLLARKSVIDGIELLSPEVRNEIAWIWFEGDDSITVISAKGKYGIVADELDGSKDIAHGIPGIIELPYSVVISVLNSSLSITALDDLHYQDAVFAIVADLRPQNNDTEGIITATKDHGILWNGSPYFPEQTQDLADAMVGKITSNQKVIFEGYYQETVSAGLRARAKLKKGDGYFERTIGGAAFEQIMVALRYIYMLMFASLKSKISPLLQRLFLKKLDVLCILFTKTGNLRMLAH